MEWQDEGIVISTRPFGESSAILDAFTAQHGRHAGVVRGGTSRKMAPYLQPGCQVALSWRARLGDQLGAYVVEPLRSRAGLLADPLALAGLNSVCAMLSLYLPDREAQPGLYAQTQAFLAQMEGVPVAQWAPAYLRWEMLLLEEIGFGLDLSRCAVTGHRDDLAFVSPKTGRAVSRTGAGDWASRLLPLPQGLLGQGPMSRDELAAGLAITGHFLARASAMLGRQSLPEARGRLLDLLMRHLPPA